MAEPLLVPDPRIENSAPVPPGAYGWFVGSVVSWFTAWGMQHVLFSWLVVGVIRADPGVVGLAQTCLMLPGIGGLLFGGAVADRHDRRRVLLGLYVGTAVGVAALVLVVGAGRLTVPVLLIYALAWGTAQAFVLPARDALVSDVTRGDLMRSITAMTLAQFAAQAGGNLVGGSARWIGTEVALCVQSGVLLCGVVPLLRLKRGLRPTKHDPVEGETGTVAQIRAGLREVIGSERLRTLTLLVMGNGLFFVGPFFVLFPIMVRDVYDGDVAVLSVAMMMFPLGTIVGSFFLLLRGGIRRKGRALAMALFAGAVALAAQALEPSLPVFLGLILLWGLCGSVFLNTSRTLYQQAAPPSHRGRVLSVYSLGLMGMAPVGTSLSGLVAGSIGAPLTCAVAGILMALLVTTIASRTRVVEMR